MPLATETSLQRVCTGTGYPPQFEALLQNRLLPVRPGVTLVQRDKVSTPLEPTGAGALKTVLQGYIPAIKSDQRAISSSGTLIP
jgi:hypothetical protein